MYYIIIFIFCLSRGFCNGGNCQPFCEFAGLTSCACSDCKSCVNIEMYVVCKLTVYPWKAARFLITLPYTFWNIGLSNLSNIPYWNQSWLYQKNSQNFSLVLLFMEIIDDHIPRYENATVYQILSSFSGQLLSPLLF